MSAYLQQNFVVQNLAFPFIPGDFLAAAFPNVTVSTETIQHLWIPIPELNAQLYQFAERQRNHPLAHRRLLTTLIEESQMISQNPSRNPSAHLEATLLSVLFDEQLCLFRKMLQEEQDSLTTLGIRNLIERTIRSPSGIIVIAELAAVCRNRLELDTYSILQIFIQNNVQTSLFLSIFKRGISYLNQDEVNELLSCLSCQKQKDTALEEALQQVALSQKNPQHDR